MENIFVFTAVLYVLEISIKGGNMKTLVSLMKKYWWYYVIGFCAMLTSIILDMFNPILQKTIIDDVIKAGKSGLFIWIILGLAGITIGRAVLGYIKEYMFDLSSSAVIVKFRRILFDHIQTLSFSFFDKINTGELMSRVKEDVENIMNAICFGIMIFTEQIIYFIMGTIVLFYLNWKMALVSIIIMPLIGYIAMKLENVIGGTYEKISDQRAVLNTTAQENLAGVRLVKAFAREKYEMEKFLKQNVKTYDLNVHQSKIWAKYQPIIEFLSNTVVVMVTVVGGYFVIDGDISTGTLVACCNYIYMLIWPMRMSGWLINVLSQCRASLKKIDVLLKEEADIKSPEQAQNPEKVDGRITFRDVSLTLNGTNILKNINLDVPPGSTLAIMGETGSGKSSLINLIGRYYDVTEGSVLVDDIDVRNYDLYTLRKNVSVVMQDVFLFSDTIEENIRFGATNISDIDIMKAAKAAKVHEFAKKMSDGYATVIGERGVGLSGGQKQRISIARALAKNSSILVFDDATSALDMETEHEIQKALEQYTDRTKVIIAHRVSAVKNADEIIILKDGEIIERGNHNTLMALRGRYYDTYITQLGDISEVFDEEEGVEVCQ